MDSFTSASKLWLRDLLHEEGAFENARVMTYGYNSRLFDEKSTECLEDWANSLLHQLCDLRSTELAASRPLILICHSMGGLVARKTIERLYQHPSPSCDEKILNTWKRSLFRSARR